MPERIGAIVRARMGSSRLPGKSLKLIAGKPLLAHLIDRLKLYSRIDEIVIATTTDSIDDPICVLAQEMGVKHFRGSEEDCLLRVLQAAKKWNIDTIIELTGDNPLMELSVLDGLIELFSTGKYDYVANNLKRTYPRGIAAKIFRTRDLEAIENITKDPAEREHVSLYFYEHPEKYRLGNLEAPVELARPELRFTVDTQEDFDFVSKVFGSFYPKTEKFTLAEALRVVDKNPEWKKINEGIQVKSVR